MKLFKKILIIGIFLLALFFICLHIVVNIVGKSLVITKLEDTFKRKARIGSLTTSFPTTIHVKSIEVEGLFKIDGIIASGGLFDIFRKSFGLQALKVIHPFVTIEKGFVKSTTEALIPSEVNLQKDSSQEQPKTETKADEPNLNPLAAMQNKFLSPKFSIGRFIVSDGTVSFTDKSMIGKELIVKAEHINLRVDNLNFNGEKVHISSFDLKGDIPWGETAESGKIEAKGWIDLGPKDMDGKFELKNVEVAVFAPYCQNFISTKKLHSGKLNFIADLKAKNNDLLVKCHLEFSDIVYQKEEQGEGEKSVSDLFSEALGIFSDASGKVTFDFSFNTKLDNPRIDLINLKGTIAQAAAQNIAAQPPENVIEKVKETAKKFKEFGKNLKDIFKKEE